MIDRFKQAFLEEARELLIELESALLELDQKRERSGNRGPGIPGAAHHQGFGRDVRLRRHRPVRA